MPDFVKKIKKTFPHELRSGEELIAATIGQPAGTFSRQALGGIVGVLAARKMAERRTADLDGADAVGMAATIPPGLQLVIGLTDQRVLFFEQGIMSGNPKQLVASFPITDVHEMTLEKHKMTYSLVVRFVDNSARLVECVKMAKPQPLVDAFTRSKESRAA